MLELTLFGPRSLRRHWSWTARCFCDWPLLSPLSFPTRKTSIQFLREKLSLETKISIYENFKTFFNHRLLGNYFYVCSVLWFFLCMASKMKRFKTMRGVGQLKNNNSIPNRFQNSNKHPVPVAWCTTFFCIPHTVAKLEQLCIWYSYIWKVNIIYSFT